MGWRRLEGRGEAYHVEGCPGGDGGVLPLDIFDADTWEADRYDGPEAENFFDKGGYVGNALFDEAFIPGVAVGIHFLNLGIGVLLDFLTVSGGQVADGHDQIAGYGIQTGGDHGEADRLDLSWREGVSKRDLRLTKQLTFVQDCLRVLKDITRYARLVFTLRDLIP